MSSAGNSGDSGAGTRSSVSSRARSTCSFSASACPEAAAAATSSGSFTVTTVRWAATSPESATAWRSARSEAGEKSIGQRMAVGSDIGGFRVRAAGQRLVRVEVPASMALAVIGALPLPMFTTTRSPGASASSAISRFSRR